MKNTLLIFLITTFFLVSIIYAIPSDEEMDCLVEKIIEDCRNFIIAGDCEEQADGSFHCEKFFDNNDKEGIRDYLLNWMVDWEKQATLVQYRSPGFGCVNKQHFTEAHTFKVDSNYNPLWDGKRVSCPSNVTKVTENITNNLTILGVSLISNGGITIIGFTVISIVEFTVLGLGIYFIIKKRKLSIRNYTIFVRKKPESKGSK